MRPIHHFLQLPSAMPGLTHGFVGREERRQERERPWSGLRQDGTDIPVDRLYENEGSQSFQSGLRTLRKGVPHVTEYQRKNGITRADRGLHWAGSQGSGSLCLFYLQH